MPDETMDALFPAECAALGGWEFLGPFGGLAATRASRSPPSRRITGRNQQPASLPVRRQWGFLESTSVSAQLRATCMPWGVDQQNPGVVVRSSQIGHSLHVPSLRLTRSQFCQSRFEVLSLFRRLRNTESGIFISKQERLQWA